MVYMALGLGIVVAMVVGIHLMLEPARVLRLGVFRPYRGLSWPVGVQEDDDVRFQWVRATPRAVGSGPDGPAATVWATTSPVLDDDSEPAQIEDLGSAELVAHHIDRIDIHRAPR